LNDDAGHLFDIHNFLYSFFCPAFVVLFLFFYRNKKAKQKKLYSTQQQKQPKGSTFFPLENYFSRAISHPLKLY